MNSMKAIILAAGSGTRLEKYTKKLPKPLVDVNGRSIIERQISLLQKEGITEIYVVRGYKKEKFTFHDVEFIDDDHYMKHDQLGSLIAAKSKISGNVLILFADILFEDTILKQIQSIKAEVAISVDLNWKNSYELRTDNYASEADKVLINNGKIIEISKNIQSEGTDKDVGEFLGILKLSEVGSKSLSDKLEKLENFHEGKFHDAVSFDNAKLVDILQELVESKINIIPVIIKGKWCEIDTLMDLELAEKLFK